MSFANGKCLVTKKEGECLVLPKGTFSPTRVNYISKEGCEKLLEVLKESTDKVKGVCVINRQEYDNCIFIPRGIINPKIRFLMSPDAIQGMAAQFSGAVETPPPAAPPAEETPPPPAEEPAEEVVEETTKEVVEETVEETTEEKAADEPEEAERTDEDRRIKSDEPALNPEE